MIYVYRTTWLPNEAGDQHIEVEKNGHHLGDDIFNCILLMNMFGLRLKIHLILFLRVQWWLIYRRIYASLGLNELNAYKREISYGRCI